MSHDKGLLSFNYLQKYNYFKKPVKLVLSSSNNLAGVLL